MSLFIHGQSRRGKWTKEYQAWKDMKARVHNVRHRSFQYYGGRGITISKSWDHSFETFFLDMGKCPPGMTLDRIENDGPYTPTNCRWATWRQQAHNTRNNRLITYRGVCLPLAAWARRAGVRPDTLWRRLDAGWNMERALTTRPREKR